MVGIVSLASLIRCSTSAGSADEPRCCTVVCRGVALPGTRLDSTMATEVLFVSDDFFVRTYMTQLCISARLLSSKKILGTTLEIAK